MPALHNTLANFASSIVLGMDLLPETQALCPEYSVETALEIYRNNYRGNLHDTLAYAYPVIEQLVGKEFFRYLTQQYIARHPSASGNLHHYGAEVANFIAGFESAQGLVYLSDIALLEWACHRAYFADDVAKLDVSRLLKIHPEDYVDMVLYTHPASNLVRSSHPIAAIWNAHQPGSNGDFHINLDSGPSNALVSRKNNTVIVSELAEADAVWLHYIRSGISLVEATANALERYPEFDLNAVLANLVEREILTNFTLENG